MLTPDDMKQMEDALAEAGATVDQLCKEAGIDRSTWTRWKNKSSAPGLAKWRDALAAYDRLTREAGHGETSA